MEVSIRIRQTHILTAFGLGLALLVMPLSVEAVSTLQLPEATTVKPMMQLANTFVFSPRTLRWKAINNKGKVVRSGRGSGGRSYCKDVRRACKTPTGTFRIISKRGANCRSSRYPLGRGGAPMPYCMFFSKYYAIHGSPDVPNYNASHGCVRVKPNDARWLHKNFIRIGTKVIIKSY
ncbi:MAG: L,D-transpeptidase [Legionellaceae bacterium]|nr:L,D-transpeptidase [Legionellaceae bacterium]